MTDLQPADAPANSLLAPQAGSRCFNCEQYGHISAHCKMPCGRCGSEVHKSRDCYMPRTRTSYLPVTPSAAPPPVSSRPSDSAAPSQRERLERAGLTWTPRSPPPAYSSLVPIKPAADSPPSPPTEAIARSLSSAILGSSSDFAERMRLMLPLLLVAQAWRRAIEALLWEERTVRSPAELMSIVEPASARPDVLDNARRLRFDLDAQAAPVIALLLGMCTRVIDLDVALRGADEDAGALLDAVLAMQTLRKLVLAVEQPIPASFVAELLEACPALAHLSLSAIDDTTLGELGRTALRSFSVRGSIGIDLLERLLVASPDMTQLDLDDTPFTARLVLRLFKDHSALGQLATLRLASAANKPRSVEARLLGAMCRLRGINLVTV